jgi:conjugal transfer pilus assembly protein TraB
MPAKLLTGLKAKTVESAREDPEPMLLRIQAPAVLPTEVRAQLQGCFVIAHGYGSLASERVEARLVSLSCVDFEGRSVIEEEIKGILVDQDGVKGLAGHPVTKMGANLSRLFVAGLVEGAGEALAATSSTTSISPLGQTSTIDTDQMGRAGLGRGISAATGELSRIYAELVRQSSPVIEVGPSKAVSVLVTEGVWLEVNDYATDESI